MQLALPFNATLVAFHHEKQRHVNLFALLDVYIVVSNDKFVPLRFIEMS